MADTKISALTASTTPLAGTEVLPIVQSSTTVKVSVANLTAGRAVTTGTLNVTSGTNAGTTEKFVLNTTDGSNNMQLVFSQNGTTSHSIQSVQQGVGYKQLVLQPSGSDTSTGAGNLVIGTSGKGIDFSAASHAAGMTSELLDDYEEGDWTPALSIGGSITYTSQVGRYTKIGRQVTVYYSIVVATASGGAGAVQMNLPFACSGVHVDKQGYPGLIGLQTTSNSGITHTGFYDDSVTVFFYGPSTTLIGTEVLANDILTGSITYFAAT